MGHYLLNFLFATCGMVLLLYALYMYIRQNPNLGGLGNLSAGQNKGLKVVSVMNLEPRKRIYVIGYKEQRFLVATTMDKTELLATLESEPCEETSTDVVPLESAGIANNAPPVEPGAGFMERFRYSLKMVFAERFSGPGGR